MTTVAERQLGFLIGRWFDSRASLGRLNLAANVARSTEHLAHHLLQDSAVISLYPKLMDRIGHLNDYLTLDSITHGDASEPAVEFGAYARTKKSAGLFPKKRSFVSRAGLGLTRRGKFIGRERSIMREIHGGLKRMKW